MTLVGYLRVFIPALADPLLMVCVAIAAIWLCTLINLRGLESATVPADDVEDPRRTIRATLFGTLAAAALHPLDHCGAGPDAAGGAGPLHLAVRRRGGILMGDWGYYLVAAGAVIACLGALNGWVLLQGQIPVAPARDGCSRSRSASSTRTARRWPRGCW